MTTPRFPARGPKPADVYTFELHGGNHDGLVLASGAFHTRMVFPCEGVLTPAEYLKWHPQAGMHVAVYRWKEERPRESGVPIQHMYLEDTYLLADRNP